MTTGRMTDDEVWVGCQGLVCSTAVAPAEVPGAAVEGSDCEAPLGELHLRNLEVWPLGPVELCAAHFESPDASFVCLLSSALSSEDELGKFY